MGGIGLKLFQIDFQRIIGVLGGECIWDKGKRIFRGN